MKQPESKNDSWELTGNSKEIARIKTVIDSIENRLRSPWEQFVISLIQTISDNSKKG